MKAEDDEWTGKASREWRTKTQLIGRGETGGTTKERKNEGRDRTRSRGRENMKRQEEKEEKGDENGGDG